MKFLKIISVENSWGCLILILIYLFFVKTMIIWWIQS